MRTKEALALRKSEGVRLGRRRGSDVKMEIIRENETEIERMLEEGMSVSMMCRKIGVARSTWYKYQEKKTVRSV
jgi:DNA invertase Pin-like site-specific DNA recombinase